MFMIDCKHKYYTEKTIKNLTEALNVVMLLAVVLANAYRTYCFKM